MKIPCPELDVFSSDFCEHVVWNVNAGEPAAAPQPETEAKEEWDDNKAQEEIKIVAQLDQASRAACLALFGPVPGITTAQYGQIVDLKNDDEPSFARELAEALAKERRALALAPERQEQCSPGYVRTQKILHSGRTSKSRSLNGSIPQLISSGC
jgi:exodeoxyribonuclease VIII